MSVREEDLDDRKVITRLTRVGNMAYNAFRDLLEVREKQSEYRRLNLSQKRFKKPASQTSTAETTSLEGPPFSPPHPNQPTTGIRLPKVAETRAAVAAATTSTTTTATTPSTGKRIVSDASIADPEQSSTGGTRVFANNEKASDLFANNLIRYVLDTVWPEGTVLDWVEGRDDGETTLVWNSGYSPPLSTICWYSVQGITCAGLTM